VAYAGRSAAVDSLRDRWGTGVATLRPPRPRSTAQNAAETIQRRDQIAYEGVT